MNLLDSLLDAIVRLDGDALVMHVGEKPYVVTTSATMNKYRGPLAWGQVELSTRVLTTDAVLGMLGQILSPEQRQSLDEYGAIEHEIGAAAGLPHRFTVVVARGGDDVWLEVRRRSASVLPAAEIPLDEAAPEAADEEEAAHVRMPADAVSDMPSEVGTEPPAFEVVHDEVQTAPTAADVDAMLGGTSTATRTAPQPLTSQAETREPVSVAGSAPALEPEPAPVREPAVAFEPEPEPIAAPVLAAPVAIEHEPEPVVERVAAYSVTLEAETQPVRESPAAPVVRAFEPEPVRERSVVITPDAVRPEEESVAEPIAAIDLETAPVREPAAAAARVVIEPEPEPMRDVVVAFRPEPRPVLEPISSIEPVPDAIVVERGQPPVISVEPETVPVQQQEVTLEAESVVEPAAAIEPEISAIAEPALAAASEPEPVLERRVTIQPEPQPVPEPAVVVAPEPLSAAAAPESVVTATQGAAVSATPELVAAPTPPPDAAPELEPAAATMPEPAAAPDSTPARGIEPEQVVEPEPVAAKRAEELIDQRPAIVLPLSRSPIKTDQPAAESRRPAAVLPLDRVLRIAAARGAATVYVIAQSAPMIRVDGEISSLDGETPWTSADIDRLVMDLAPARVRDVGQAAGEWVTDVPDVGRVRCVTFRDHRGPGVIFRMIPPRAISAEQLGLSVEIQALCSQSDGLVLVTGARASGKSTLLSAFVDVINRTRSDHVITLEPQIGFVHESRRSFVSQREVRGDSEQTAAAVRSAFREDPDVLMIEDLRTPEIVALALEGAESGRLVFGSIAAASAVAAIDRLIELFPAERRAQAQTSLAGSLRGVVSQVLLRKSRGGRVAAREVLLNTPAVAGLIMEGKTFQLPVALDSGRRQGMMPLADSLAALVRDGTVQAAEAYRKAPDREALLTILRREGVDMSFVERLA